MNTRTRINTARSAVIALATVAIIILLTALTAMPALAQEGTGEATGQATDAGLQGPSSFQNLVENRAVVAMTDPDYIVTPGDLIRVSYNQSFNPVSLDVLVQYDFTVDLGPIGRLDARDKSFITLRNEVQATVREAYPNSTPSVVLVSLGSFEIFVTGEVTEATRRRADGFTRLSSVVNALRTPYSSIRDVAVTTTDGTTTRYDLFRATRGDFDQNPLVQPGMRIVVEEADRRVTVGGRVRRPGTYQLLEGEGIAELIQEYGDGFREDAYRGELRIARAADTEADATRSIYISEPMDSDFALRDSDTVEILSIESFLPVVYVEGPVSGESAAGFEEAPTRRVQVRFRPGERMSTALRSVVDRLNPTAVLSEGVLIRDGVRIPVDLRPLIFSRTPANDPELQAEDIISIPARQLLVAVEGAVAQPGNYPYVVGQDMDYYIALAGGRITDRALGNAGYVVTPEGTRRAPEDPIDAEDRIVVPTNNPMHYVETYAGVVGSVASVVTSILLALNAVTGGN